MTDSPRTSVPYGPATARVRRCLVQLAGLGAEPRREVVARHDALTPTSAYAAAEASLGETIERSGRTDARDALAGPLLQLVRRPHSVDVNDGLDTLDPIAEPALAALLAILVADLLPPEQTALLYAPFESVMPFESLK
jgi:hypothetical protein